MSNTSVKQAALQAPTHRCKKGLWAQCNATEFGSSKHFEIGIIRQFPYTGTKPNSHYPHIQTGGIRVSVLPCTNGRGELQPSIWR